MDRLQEYVDCRRAGMHPGKVMRLMRVSYDQAVAGLAAAGAVLGGIPALALAAKQCGCELRTDAVEDDSPFGPAFPSHVAGVVESVELKYPPLSVAVQRYSEAVG